MEEQYKDIEKLIKEAGVEIPSPNFVQNVMRQVEVSESRQPIVYQSLISKKAWWIIGLIVLPLLLWLGFTAFSEANVSIFSRFDFSSLRFVNANNPFSGFVLPKTSIYGVLFLGILFFVQVTYLKKRIDRSFS